MAEKKGYSTSKWHGHTNYECSDCPFSTLDEKEMKDHRWVHDQDVSQVAHGGAETEGGGN
jgi:hypothetical protein